MLKTLKKLLKHTRGEYSIDWFKGSDGIEQINRYELLLDYGLALCSLDLKRYDEGYPIYRLDYYLYVDVDVINDIFTHKQYLIWLVRQNELAGLEAYKMTIKQLEELLEGKELETYETTFWGVENDI